MAERKQKGGSRFLSVRPAAFLFKQKDGHSVFLLLSFLKFFLHEKERREKAYCEKKDVWLPIVALKIFPAFAKNSFVVEKARALSKNIPSRLQVFVFSFRLFLSSFPSYFFFPIFSFLFSFPIFPLFLFYKRKPPEAKRGRFSELCTLIKICRQAYLFLRAIFSFPAQNGFGRGVCLTISRFLGGSAKSYPRAAGFHFFSARFFQTLCRARENNVPFSDKGIDSGNLSRALLSPEEQRHRTRSRMTADGGADAVNLHFSVEIFKAAFDEIRHRAGVLITGGIGNITFARIV